MAELPYILGEDPVFLEVEEQISRLAAINRPCLVVGRARHREGTARDPTALPLAAVGRSSRQGELRRSPRVAARHRALRPRSGGIHRRAAPARGPLRTRGRGDAAARRNRECLGDGAGKSAPSHRVRGDGKGRRTPDHPTGRAGHRGGKRRSAVARTSRSVSGRPARSPRIRGRHDPTASGPAGRHHDGSRTRSRWRSPAPWARASFRDSARARKRCSSDTRGPETCES